MTALATRAKLEKELYPPITALLKDEGYRVWEEATIRAGEEGTRTADHVAWQWEGEEIRALAVEVKPGQADVGLAQAAAYSAGFDAVFVAAEEPFVSTGYLGAVFARLGLGYIRVTPTDASIERDADPSPFIVDTVRAENLARVRLRHLFVETWSGDENVWFGGDRRGDNWAVTGTTSEWQLCGQVVTGSSAAYLSLLAESKQVGDSAAAKLEGGALAASVRSIGPSTEVILQERRHNGFQGSYSGVLRVWSPDDDDDTALDALLSFARTLSGPRVGPHFEIRTELWPHGTSLTEADARRDFEEALTRLRAVQSILNEGL